MTPVMVKVYGFLRPVTPAQVKELEKSLGSMGEEAAGVLELNGSLLNISYEGVFFPIGEFLHAAEGLVQAGAQGKTDYLDLEEWTLTRHLFENGIIMSTRRNLNDVMAYSGH